MNGKPFAAVVDIFPQLCLARYDVKMVGRILPCWLIWRKKRIYFVVCPPCYLSFSVSLAVFVAFRMILW